MEVSGLPCGGFSLEDTLCTEVLPGVRERRWNWEQRAVQLEAELGQEQLSAEVGRRLLWHSQLPK